MNPLLQCKPTILPLLIALVLVCFGLSPATRAVVPPPDGGYPGFNTAEGENALFSLTSGTGNTAIGHNALFSDTEGSWNTGVGAVALGFNDGEFNTAVGAAALLLNTTGSFNTAVGTALVFNDSGSSNTALGYNALKNSVGGDANTAVGRDALFSGNSGYSTAIGYLALFGGGGGANTAVGVEALYGNTTGDSNTATGMQALYSNTTGRYNMANGINALFYNSEGGQNTAVGASALYFNTTGGLNTGVGIGALGSNTNGTGNTAVGYQSLFHMTDGSYNIAVEGGGNLISGNFNIYIGNDGGQSETGVIRIGSSCCQTHTYIAGIYGAGVSSGATVYVNSDGKLGTSTSSQRFKEQIKPMEQASEALHALKPVTFRYKKGIDPQGIPQFGLVAEEVEKVNPDLVVHDPNGEPYSVRYEQINAMLLNEFLKEHRKVEHLTKAFESKFAEMQKQIETLTAGLQKVSAQLAANPSDGRLALSKPAAEVGNDP